MTYTVRSAAIDQLELIVVGFYKLRNQLFSPTSPEVIFSKNNLLQPRGASSEDPAKFGCFLSS